jgi:hypothetical protein
MDKEPITSLVARRANLRAVGRHVALHHEAPSFRDCSHPLCCDAAGLVPFLPGADQPALDADLGLIFDRVQAALEAGNLQRDKASMFRRQRQARNGFAGEVEIPLRLGR